MKAITYSVNTEAPYGLYLSLSPVDVRFVGSTGEALDGLQGARYVRLPTWLLVATGPLVGAAFVVALPVLIVAAMFLAGVHALSHTDLAQRHAYVARGGFDPSASYFRGASGRPTAIDPALADLADEVQARIEAVDAQR